MRGLLRESRSLKSAEGNLEEGEGGVLMMVSRVGKKVPVAGCMALWGVKVPVAGCMALGGAVEREGVG